MALITIHTWFDLLSAFCSATLTVIIYRWRLAEQATSIAEHGFAYAAALVGGAVIGGYFFGTLNLWLSGIEGIGRSIVGALAGAITAIEVIKKSLGIRQSTGLIFVPAFCGSLIIGRVGCFFSGLSDHTHGRVSDMPWAYDYGDGLLRHPVQLYESIAMLAFLIITIIALQRRFNFFQRNGFYLLVIWYASQRFGWEFLKPYETILGPFNVFHIVCFGLIVYAVTMIVRNAYERSHS